MKINEVCSSIYIIILSLCFFQRSTHIQISNGQINVMTIFLLIFVIFILIVRRKKNYEIDEVDKNDKKNKKMLLCFVVPYIFIGIYSIVITLYNGLYQEKLIEKTIVTITMFLVSILLAYFSVKTFKENIIKYILTACILNYSIVIIFYILDNGISGLLNFKYLNENFIDTSLEVHELAYIFALFLLYFVIYKKTNKKIIYVILCLFLYLGMKRIIIGALFVIGIIYVFTKMLKLKKELIIKINTIFSFTIVIVYLFLSTTELSQLTIFFENMGIDMMGRDSLYAYFQEQCHLEITYLGKGIRSTDLLLSLSPELKYFSAIHNDILRIYFELGFIVFFMYFINYIILNTNRIQKNTNIEVSLLYSYLTLFSVICYTTDNTFVYYRYLFVFYTIVFLAVFNNSKECKKDKNLSDIYKNNI